jgi:hypothetical protein
MCPEVTELRYLSPISNINRIVFLTKLNDVIILFDTRLEGLLFMLIQLLLN